MSWFLYNIVLGNTIMQTKRVIKSPNGHTLNKQESQREGWENYVYYTTTQIYASRGMASVRESERLGKTTRL
jgi:hypothetical protein